jgi:hypothetical protein
MKTVASGFIETTDEAGTWQRLPPGQSATVVHGPPAFVPPTHVGPEMNPIPVNVTPRFSAEAEVARTTATAAAPSRIRDFLMLPPLTGAARCITWRDPWAVPA